MNYNIFRADTTLLVDTAINWQVRLNRLKGESRSIHDIENPKRQRLIYEMFFRINTLCNSYKYFSDNLKYFL